MEYNLFSHKRQILQMIRTFQGERKKKERMVRRFEGMLIQWLYYVEFKNV